MKSIHPVTFIPATLLWLVQEISTNNVATLSGRNFRNPDRNIYAHHKLCAKRAFLRKEKLRSPFYQTAPMNTAGISADIKKGSVFAVPG